MKKVLQVFREEAAWTRRSFGAAAVFLACLLLPALYIWFTLSAAWDPFGQTSGLAVAIVSEDAGDSERKWNLGEELLAGLEADGAAGYVRMGKAEAVNGVNAGQYHAAVIVPETFSTQMWESLAGNGERPKIAFYFNEKKNVLMPKGSDGLGLVQRRVADALERALLKVLRLPADASAEEVDLPSALAQADEELAACETTVQALLAVSAAAVGAQETEAAPVENSLAVRLAAAQEAAGDAVAATQSALREQGGLEEARESSALVAEGYRECLARLNELNRQAPFQDADAAIALLEEGISRQERVVALFDAALAEVGTRSADTERALAAAVDEARGDANYINRYYQRVVGPRIGEAGAEAGRTAERYGVEPAGDDSREELAALESRLGEARSRLRTVRESLQLAGASSGLGGLVEVDQQILYSVDSYGSASAPACSAAALLLGCLLLAARRRNNGAAQGLKPRHTYWGQAMAFLLAALVQATLLCLTELLLLGVQCRSPFLFLLSGWVSALAYGGIVFGLTQGFGRGGGAACVLLLAVEAACVGAAFPAETAPAVYQWVCALLPGTYGAGAMRETVAGLYRSEYLHSLLLLLAYSPVFLAVGKVAGSCRSGALPQTQTH